MRNDTSLPPQADEYGRRVSPYYSLEDKKAKYQADKLFKRLRRKTGQAIGDYGMIREHDRILVGMSGGKDSYALLDLLLSLRRSAPVAFELIPVHIDAGYPGSPVELLEEHLKKVGLKYYIIKKNIAKICADKLPPGKTWCPLCSRMRRGYLYGAAKDIGANKLALGHHKDDVLCTFFMNLFFSGIMKSMPPILRTDRDDFTLIRPLVYCRERDLKLLARIRQYPLFPKGLCGWGEDQQRTEMRRMIASWSENYPKRADIVFKALKNVVPSHLFDRKLFDFSKIRDAAPLKGIPGGFGAFPKVRGAGTVPFTRVTAGAGAGEEAEAAADAAADAALATSGAGTMAAAHAGTTVRSSAAAAAGSAATPVTAGSGTTAADCAGKPAPERPEAEEAVATKAVAAEAPATAAAAPACTGVAGDPGTAAAGAVPGAAPPGGHTVPGGNTAAGTAGAAGSTGGPGAPPAALPLE